MRSEFESEYWRPELQSANNLSRLLALFAVHLTMSPNKSNDYIIEITDGGDDDGIDAVGIDQASKLVVFVQSKWRLNGKGSLKRTEILAFIDGVKSLIGMKSSSNLVNASEETRRQVNELLRTPGAKIALVTATTASDPLSTSVQKPITDLLEQLNDLDGIEPLARYVHYTQADLFRSISDHDKPAVDLKLQILDWGRASDPQKIYYGRVSGAEIADWFEQHGSDLFSENIRVVIPRSDINEGILDTVETQPQNFIYYNNGITIIADSIELGPGGRLNREVGFFELKQASIVNGAQTVSTLGAARGTSYEENLGKAFVLVRCIEVPRTESELGSRITRYANTQNEVSSQDFSFLDKEQHRLVRELKVLGYEYLLRSAEVPKHQDANRVIELRQAAVALACASSKLTHAITAKREVSRLFSDNSTYRALFNAQTDPLRLVRATQLVRKVDNLLDIKQNKTEGVESGIAVHGRRVVSHLIMKKLGEDFLSDPDSDFESALADLETQVDRIVSRFMSVFPDKAYPGNVFKNHTRVNELIKQASL